MCQVSVPIETEEPYHNNTKKKKNTTHARKEEGVGGWLAAALLAETLLWLSSIHFIQTQHVFLSLVLFPPKKKNSHIRIRTCALFFRFTKATLTQQAKNRMKKTKHFQLEFTSSLIESSENRAEPSWRGWGGSAAR